MNQKHRACDFSYFLKKKNKYHNYWIKVLACPWNAQVAVQWVLDILSPRSPGSMRPLSSPRRRPHSLSTAETAEAGGSYSTCHVYWNNTFQLKIHRLKGKSGRGEKDYQSTASEKTLWGKPGREPGSCPLGTLCCGSDAPRWWGGQNEFSVLPPSQSCPFPSIHRAVTSRIISCLPGASHILSVCGLITSIWWGQPVPGPSLPKPFAL